MSDDRLMNKPRVAALADWLEGEFDMHVYGSPTLGLMKAEDWQRLAKSALRFMDRVERDAEEAKDKALWGGKTVHLPNSHYDEIEDWGHDDCSICEAARKQPMTADERSRIEARENWTKKEAE